MWLIFVIINMFICGFLDIIEKNGSKHQPLRFWAIAILLYGIFNTVVGFILMPSVLTHFDIYALLLTLPLSLLSTIGYYCSVKAFFEASVSTVSPIMRSKIIWVLILSSIFLNDKLSILQIILIFTLLILNILLNLKKNNKSSRKGILFAFGYLFANGSATFINKVILNVIPNPISITFYTGLTAILSIVIMLLVLNNFDLLRFNKFKNKKQAFLMESLEVIGMILTRYAMLEGNVVVITAMTSSSIIIAIILSKFIFKEKIDLRKWLIILLIVIAIVLLSIISI